VSGIFQNGPIQLNQPPGRGSERSLFYVSYCQWTGKVGQLNVLIAQGT
jgi:hypothetical protein